MKIINGRFAPLIVGILLATGSGLVHAQRSGMTPPANPPSVVPTLPATQIIKVAGLQEPVKVILDRWGVPHIYAMNQDDVFFAQGFNAARDRLFQIDLWRRRGLGKLSSVFGAGFVEQDKATRQFLYRGGMEKEWLSYGKNANRVATSFVAGINAYIDLIAIDPKRMPLEFGYFGYTPEKWAAEDVVRIRSHGLTRNVLSEVARANVACRADLKSDEIRAPLSPKWETKIPEGLDPCLPKDLLKVFSLATQGVIVAEKSSATGTGPRADTGPELHLAMINADPSNETTEGSNAWVIAPSKSATGRAILANDPHRAFSTPSLRYIAHLSAPGLDVIGAGEPALPGISIGHNGTIAFGLTIFSIDQEDLYVYEINPANPMEYRYQGAWEKMRSIKETIQVKGGEPVNVELLFTRHGPMIFIEKEKNRAFAVRAGWLEAGMAPYFGSIDYMYAKNFTEFKRAMLNWGAPSENQVYADTAGNIGWAPGGLTPIRANWDGLLPVPGDGRYEWAGFLSGDKLPSVYNPKRGWFASSNEMNLPPAYSYRYRERKLGFEWANTARIQRASELLAKPGKFSLEAMMQMQSDVLSVHARRVIALLKPLRSTDANTTAALSLLTRWDARETPESAATALFEVWMARHLGVAFKDAVLSAAAAGIIAQPNIEAVINGLENPSVHFGKNAMKKRDQVMLVSLKAAFESLQQLYRMNGRSADSSLWHWSDLHYALLEHPLANAVDTATKAKLNVGPMAKAGGANTLNVSSYNAATFQQTGGASFRIVVDVGNWDQSRAVNTPGQSGNVDSPHYRDLAEKWSKGEYFPLLYSRKMIEDAAEQRFELQPAK